MKINKKFKITKIIIGLILFIAILPVNIYLSENWIEINTYNLTPDKLPEEFRGFTILQLSDNHIIRKKDIKKNIDFFNATEKKLLKSNKRIDCVVITGDLLDDKSKMVPEAVAFVEAILTKYPVYFVEGNHDSDGDLTKGLLKIGVTVLQNKTEKLIRGTSTIYMTGVGDLSTNRNDEDKAFNAVPINDFDITLVHQPSNFKKLTNYGADLVLCGHTHGGQIRIPFLPVLFAPGQGFLPKYGYGFYEEKRPDLGQSVMYVNKGIGYSGLLNFRLFNRPEISVFILE